LRDQASFHPLAMPGCTADLHLRQHMHLVHSNLHAHDMTVTVAALKRAYCWRPQ
jgi:hypothetical protein